MQCSEFLIPRATIHWCSIKSLFRKILQDLPESVCAFHNKIAGSRSATLLRRDSDRRVNFAKIFRKIFFGKKLWASDFITLSDLILRYT